MTTALLLYLGVRDLPCLIYAGLFDVTVSVILASSFVVSGSEE